MAHPWKDLVVGGISKPRFLIVSENYCTNPRMNSGTTTGWSVSSSLITLSAYETSYAYSQYVLRAIWTESVYEYINYDFETDDNLEDVDSILAVFRIWDSSLNDNEVKVIKVSMYNGLTRFSQKNIEITNKPKRISILADNIPNKTSKDVQLRIYTGIEFNSSGDMQMDNFYLMQSLEDYQFDCPQDDFLRFEKDLIGSHELQDGRIQEYNKAWRPNYYAYYLSMTKQNEKYRQRISEANNVFVIPHIDFMWGFFAKWTNEFLRKYTMKRYIGHDSEITLMGNELLKGTIHPIDVQYEPPPTLFDLIISSNVDGQAEVFVYISPDDNYGFSDGVTPFVRSFESETNVTILAPSTVNINGEEKSFQGWYDIELDVILTTNVSYSFEVNSELQLEARYDVTISPSGDGYGTGYGTGYGDQL